MRENGSNGKTRTGPILGVITPFTDTDFRPSAWRPSKWRNADRLHYLSIQSSFPSRKARSASVDCESTLESDMAVLLEVDAAVSIFREQPIGPDWHDGHGWRAGGARDFWVETDGGNLLVEVKRSAELLADPALRDRLNRMALSYHVQGVRMVVRTERTIRSEPRLGNARILHQYAFGTARRAEAEIRRLTTLRPGPVTVAEIKAEIGDDDEAFGAVCRLALAGDVTVDLSRPLGSATLASWETPR